MQTRDRIVGGSVLPLLLLLALVGCNPTGPAAPPSAPPPAQVPPATPPPLELDGRQLINREAGWRLTLPDGWTVRDEVSPALLVVDRDGTDAALAVLMRPAAPDAITVRDQLAATLTASPAGYEVLAIEERTVGGRPAGVLVSAHPMPAGRRVTRNVIVAGEDRTWVFGWELAEADGERLAPEIERTLQSVRFD